MKQFIENLISKFIKNCTMPQKAIARSKSGADHVVVRLGVCCRANGAWFGGIAEEKAPPSLESAFRTFFISDFSSKTDIILKKDMVSDKKYIGFSTHRVYNIRGNK